MHQKFTSYVGQCGKQRAHSDWGEFTVYKYTVGVKGIQPGTVRYPEASQSRELLQTADCHLTEAVATTNSTQKEVSWRTNTPTSFSSHSTSVSPIDQKQLEAGRQRDY